MIRLSEATSGSYLCVSMEESLPGMLRLQQLGLCADRKLELLAAGNPLIVLVGATKIGVSRQLADHIIVKAYGED